MWWPHPVHGSIVITEHEHVVVFECSCGERFGLPTFVAHEYGMIE